MRIKRIICITLLLLAFGKGANAQIPLDVRINGSFLQSHNSFIEDGVSYVPFRSSAEALGFDVSWDGKSPIAGGMEFSDCVFLSGTAYIPARRLSGALGASVLWDELYCTVDIFNREHEPDDSLMWLSRIIHAESEGEVFEGMVAVGNVVMNRVASEQYPSTVYEVIFDKKHGVQFTPTINGKIYNTPSKSATAAAKLAMRGHSVVGDSLFFLNEKISTNKWIVNNRQDFATIGNHNFYL